MAAEGVWVGLDQEFFTVGVVTGPHGLRGDLRVFSRTDFPERRFVKGARLWVAPPEGESGETLEPVVVSAARLHNRVYIVSFVGFDSIDKVERLKGRLLRVPREDLPSLPDGEYYIRDLIGCAVYVDDGSELGILTDVLTPGANDVYVVARTGAPDVLLPAIPDCILKVDVLNKRIDVHLMPGLLD